MPKNRTVLRMFDVSRGIASSTSRRARLAMTQNFYVMQAPARMENFQPHMHMRGKAMSVEAVYPDGRKEVLSAVNNFQWNWHVNYIYADDAAPLLPKGTVLVFTAWHDNTANNPNNPDPRQWVGWGDRTVDEMAHAWVDVTYLEQRLRRGRRRAESKSHAVEKTVAPAFRRRRSCRGTTFLGATTMFPLASAAYRFGPFVVDRAAYRVLEDGRPLDLTPKLLDLLLHLVDTAGTLVTKDALLDALSPGPT